MRYVLKIAQDKDLIEIGRTDSLQEGLGVLKLHSKVVLYDTKQDTHFVFVDGRLRSLERAIRNKLEQAQEDSDDETPVRGRAVEAMQGFRERLQNFQRSVKEATTGVAEGFYGRRGTAAEAFDDVFGRSLPPHLESKEREGGDRGEEKIY